MLLSFLLFILVLMKLFQFDKILREVTCFDSHGISVAPLLWITEAAQVTFMNIESGGVVGLHSAVVPQLFCVVSGAGWVRVEGSHPVPIQSGMAAYWEAGEVHESGSDNGMTVILVESKTVDISPLNSLEAFS